MSSTGSDLKIPQDWILVKYNFLLGVSCLGYLEELLQLWVHSTINWTTFIFQFFAHHGHHQSGFPGIDKSGEEIFYIFGPVLVRSGASRMPVSCKPSTRTWELSERKPSAPHPILMVKDLVSQVLPRGTGGTPMCLKSPRLRNIIEA